MLEYEFNRCYMTKTDSKNVSYYFGQRNKSRRNDSICQMDSVAIVRSDTKKHNIWRKVT